MMNANYQFENDIFTCNKGDLVETKSGKKYVFQKLSRVNFVGKNIEDGRMYNVRIENFLKIAERYYEKTDTTDWMKNLKKDDMFYIVKNEKCLLYKFVRHAGTGILALNPYNGVPTRISAGFEGKIL